MISAWLNRAGAPWADTNGDRFVQSNELNYSTILARDANYDPNNPSNFRSPARATRAPIRPLDPAGKDAAGGSRSRPPDDAAPPPPSPGAA